MTILSTCTQITSGMWGKKCPTMEKYYNHGRFCVWHSWLCMNDVYRKKICLLEACLLALSLCVSGTVLAPGMLLWTGAPPLFCYSIFPLFAQRLGAIIGPNTLHYSYLCSVHTRLSTKDIQVCEEANSYVHLCTEARRLAIQTQSFPLSLAWCCLLCDFVRCPEASHSWQRLWKVWICRQSPGKQIGESVYPAPPPPTIRFPPNREALRLVVSNRYKFISK